MNLFQTQIPVDRCTPTNVKSDKAICLPDFVFMIPQKNYSLLNIVQEIDGIVYTEEWEFIAGFGTDYEVSTFGRVRSNKYRAPVILRQSKNRHYYKLQLCINNVSKTYVTHRLVLKAFHPLIEGKDFCNHKDADKHNNFYKNLEWCTIQENSLHAIKLGLITMPDIRGSKNGRSVLTEENVIEIMKIGKTIKVSKLAKMFGVCKSQIHEIRRGHTWKHITTV